jgi:2,3-bisphosphoglycerate-dependent phosphoglycerate mutase
VTSRAVFNEENAMENVLVLARHGESEWNKLNLFTGWRDPDLTETGVKEARRAGKLLKAQGFTFDIAFTSALKRAQHTLQLMLDELGQEKLKTVEDQALNERDYGVLSGLNKNDARARWGEDQVLIWRRSFDIPPPGGESLKDTAARVLPYYKAAIFPEIRAGRNVLVAAHGNSLRALIMHLDKMTPEEIVELNLGTAEPYVYRLNADGSVAARSSLAA